MTSFIGPEALQALCEKTAQDYILRLGGASDNLYSSRLGRSMDARDRVEHLRKDVAKNLLEIRRFLEFGVLKINTPSVTRTAAGDGFSYKSRHVTPSVELRLGKKSVKVTNKTALDIKNDFGEPTFPLAFSQSDMDVEVHKPEVGVLIAAAFAGIEDQVLVYSIKLHEHWKEVEARTPEIVETFARKKSAVEGKAFRMKLKKALGGHDGILDQPPEHILWALRHGSKALETLSRFVHRNPVDVHVATDEEIRLALDELRAESVVKA